MNREFLKQAGVPEDQIDKIMAEYGKDIQAEKDKAAKAASDIAERDKTIETYKPQTGPRTNAFGDGYLGTRELSPYRMHCWPVNPIHPFSYTSFRSVEAGEIASLRCKRDFGSQ